MQKNDIASVQVISDAATLRIRYRTGIWSIALVSFHQYAAASAHLQCHVVLKIAPAQPWQS